LNPCLAAKSRMGGHFRRRPRQAPVGLRAGSPMPSNLAASVPRHSSRVRAKFFFFGATNRLGLSRLVRMSAHRQPSLGLVAIGLAAAPAGAPPTASACVSDRCGATLCPQLLVAALGSAPSSTLAGALVVPEGNEQRRSCRAIRGAGCRPACVDGGVAAETRRAQAAALPAIAAGAWSVVGRVQKTDALRKSIVGHVFGPSGSAGTPPYPPAEGMPVQAWERPAPGPGHQIHLQSWEVVHHRSPVLRHDRSGWNCTPPHEPPAPAVGAQPIDLRPHVASVPVDPSFRPWTAGVLENHHELDAGSR